jgi:nucleoside-diphosphate-sugar epimerase
VSHPRWRGELCLLTGATGFIGGRLAARLMGEGCAVRCLVRPHSAQQALRELGVELVAGDLADGTVLRAAACDASYVLHCAALVSDWATVAEIRATNVTGTRLLAEAAAAAGSVKRFVHISSTDVYGHPGDLAVQEDRAPIGFANWYAQTKLEGEAELLAVARTRGLQATILRPATVYGPGSRDVVGEIARAIRSRTMLLIDRGRAIAGLCYVENLIDLVLLAAREQTAAGQTYNASDGLAMTWREFAGDLAAGLGAPPPRLSLPYRAAHAIGASMEHGYRLVRSATGLRTPPLLSRQAVQVLGRNQDFSIQKARQMLGWEPRVGYEAGLAATLDWLRSSYLT